MEDVKYRPLRQFLEAREGLVVINVKCSISVLNGSAFRLFSISGPNKVDEIFAKDNEQIRVVERLFNSSLVVLVTVQKPNCLKMLHFKKKQDICNCVYPSEILCVRMNRHRLIVCLAESIHIHDIRDMKILHSIENIAPNELGLCTLSLNSQLAFPISSTSGELRIFNASKLRPGLTIRAHDTALSALNFSPNGALLATASERGTVIRVFCVKNGQRVQEFRRGVKRCVRIASLVFAVTGDFLCASSNTETVHIFKIDPNAVKAAEAELEVEAKPASVSTTAPSAVTAKVAAAKNAETTEQQPTTSAAAAVQKVADAAAVPVSASPPASTGGGWSGYLSKAVSSYLIPSQVCDVLAQDRAFATAVLAQPGLKHVCGLARLQKDLKLLVASEDGFLYIHEFSAERGGPCKLLGVHDLRCPLEGVIELNLTESMDTSSLPTSTSAATSNTVSSKTANISKPNHISTTTTKTTTSSTNAKEANSKSCAASVLIQNPDPAPDNSYAGILKGEQSASTMTDSAKFRKLCDAIDTPTKLFDERQFPPVAIAAKD